MSAKIKTVTVNAANKQETINHLEQEGLSVLSVDEVTTGKDNSKSYRITAKDFSAKLGHVDREFID